MFDVELIKKGPLTDREAEILRLVCEAKSDKDIARLLDISIKTVEVHISHIYQKIGVTHARLHRRLVCLRMALAAGLVRLLCVVLLVDSLNGVEQPARVGRGALRMPQVAKIRRLS